MIRSHSKSGVSPVIAIILMVAITIVLVGILSLWIYSLVDDEDSKSPVYHFESDLDSANDRINLTLVMGDVIDTLNMGIKIDGNDVAVPGDLGSWTAGTTITLNSPIDIVQLVKYRISVVIDNKVVWEDNLFAS